MHTYSICMRPNANIVMTQSAMAVEGILVTLQLADAQLMIGQMLEHYTLAHHSTCDCNQLLDIS